MSFTRRSKLPLLLALSLIVTLIFPSFTAMAEEGNGELMLDGLAYTLHPALSLEETLVRVPDVAVIPRTFGTYYLLFNDVPTVESLQGAVHVTNSAGADVTSLFHIYPDSSRRALAIERLQRLKRNELYTVTLKGGADGLVSSWGFPLPNDLTVNFRTDGQYLFNEAYFTSYQGWIPDLTEFPFSAGAGTGELVASGLGQDGQVKLVIRDADTKEIVSEGTQTMPLSPIRFTLPQDGIYLAAITHTYQQWDMQYGFKIQAAELDIPSRDFPEVYFRNRNLNFISDRMNLLDYVTYEGDWSDVEYMQVWLDGKKIVDNLAAPTGLMPYVLDSRELSDGTHKLHVVTKTKSSPNIGTSMLEFLSTYKLKFTDVALNYFGYHAIRNMTRKQLLSGTSVTTFEPDRDVSRKEFATMLHQAFDVTPEPEGEFPFADVKADDWSRPFIADLAALDWVSGEVQAGERVFLPERSITRAEALAMIGRALQIDPNAYVEAPAFQDWKSVPDWARASIASLTRDGCVHGFPDNTFRPQQNLSRGEAAVILNQFVKK
ncbi:hypothetical protein CBW65_08940 [Tumebacillus avium]|uniref:SLH domain-containing protein n=1 Tax=Tumebacillus avium TaxID=1903704 RepID=A0A1Y0IP82_9BACL|nr:S-layer homology domain-containing protein [Tumebacillus avium]ARU61143.1 hypothetical protein CBW65_08940 [Tumebacillus avium]